jgi:hypothetical protein
MDEVSLKERELRLIAEDNALTEKYEEFSGLDSIFPDRAKVLSKKADKKVVKQVNL